MIETDDVDRENCGNCAYAFEGICNECFGENYGWTTEISSCSWCRNWREKKE